MLERAFFVVARLQERADDTHETGVEAQQDLRERALRRAVACGDVLAAGLDAALVLAGDGFGAAAQGREERVFVCSSSLMHGWLSQDYSTSAFLASAAQAAEEIEAV